MITGVQDVYYNVEDMDRAVAFYRDVLGLRVLDTSPYWTSLDCQGARIGLHGTGGQPIPPIPHDAHGPHCGALLTLRTDDIAAEVGRLQTVGVTILGPISHDPWGRLVGFQDTEGNWLKLMQLPADT